MRFRWLLFAGLGLAACGSGDKGVAPPGATGPADGVLVNRVPILAVPRIVPSSPRSGEALSVTVKVHDPDGDRVRVEVDWYRNDVAVQSGSSLRLPGTSVARDDEIYVIARASDGKSKVIERSAPVRVGNQIPQLTQIDIFPEDANAKDELTALVSAKDAEGDPVTFTYRWHVAGRQLPNLTGPKLPAGTAHRGDEVIVSVTPHDGYEPGRTLQSQSIEIENSAPEILSKPTFTLADARTYIYPVKATDPDGDRPLRFKLIEGPPGMTMDMVSGLISWTVSSDAGGRNPVELSVTDRHGGEMRQSYVLELRWDSPPANTP